MLEAIRINEKLVYPENKLIEIKNKCNWGIAVGGAGLRGATLIHGWMRGLYMLNILDKFKYISTVSSGSWYNVLYSYMEDFDKNFLSYLAPEDCILEKILNFSNDNYLNLLKNVDLKENLGTNMCGEKWFDIIRQNFTYLENLNENYLPCIQNKTNIYIGIKYKQLRNLENSPYPIIESAIYFNELNILESEFTPLYYSIVGEYEDKNSKKIGNIILDPLLFTCQQNDIKFIGEKNNILNYELINNPKEIISISDSCALSSNAMGSFLAILNMEFFFNTTNRLTTIFNVNNNLSQKNMFLDGAIINDTSIFPLLRRLVDKIICFYPNKSELEYYKNFDDILSGEGLLAALFGRATGNNYDYYNKKNQIFMSEIWDEFKDYIFNIPKGKSKTYLLKTKLLINESAGILISYNVEIFFIFNFVSNTWINKLPKNTFDILPKNFTYYSSFLPCIDDIHIATISQNATFNILALQEEIFEFLNL